MTDITESSWIVRSPQQTSVSMPGETVILNPEVGTYYGLDDVGTSIWNLVERPTTVGVICEALVAEYDVDPDRCRRDLLALIHELCGAGLVEIRDASPH